jgi:hypothetical protein
MISMNMLIDPMNEETGVSLAGAFLSWSLGKREKKKEDNRSIRSCF